MNRYIFIRRLTGPCVLLLLGVVALLHQANLVHWELFVPLLLILLGVLKLAERAALAADGGYPPPPYPGAPYPGAPYAGAVNPTPGTAPYTAPTSSSIVPSPTHDFEKDPNGGQS